MKTKTFNLICKIFGFFMMLFGATLIVQHYYSIPHVLLGLALWLVSVELFNPPPCLKEKLKVDG